MSHFQAIYLAFKCENARVYRSFSKTFKSKTIDEQCLRLTMYITCENQSGIFIFQLLRDEAATLIIFSK